MRWISWLFLKVGIKGTSSYNWQLHGKVLEVPCDQCSFLWGAAGAKAQAVRGGRPPCVMLPCTARLYRHSEKVDVIMISHQPTINLCALCFFSAIYQKRPPLCTRDDLCSRETLQAGQTVTVCVLFSCIYSEIIREHTYWVDKYRISSNSQKMKRYLAFQHAC